MLEKITNYLQKVVFPSSRVLGTVGAGLVPILVLITVADVIMRRFFNAPIPGAFELTGLILGIVVFFTLAYCAVETGHVEVDILVSRFSLKVQNRISTIMYFLSTILLALLTWQLFKLGLRVMEMHETSVILAIWLFPFFLIATIGVAFLTLVFLVFALKKLMGASAK